MSPTAADARAPSSDAGGRWQAWILAGGLVLLALLAYSNALGGAFVFDDVKHVRDNPLVRDLGALFSWSAFRAEPRWVAYLTFALNHRLCGPSPAGYHALNVAVHAANALLVLALVQLLFRSPRLARSALAPHAPALAFVAAALFVSHPLQTQAVTYVVQRITSLAALFYLASLVGYLWWRLLPPERTRARAAGYALVLLSAVLALKTKEIAFTLPFAILLVELSFFEPGRRDLLALLPILATALLVPATWLLRASGPAADPLASIAQLTRVQTGLGRLDYLATEATVIVTYLFLMLLPIGQNLDHDYPLQHSFASPAVLSALAVLLALAGLAASLYWRTSPRARRPLDPAVRLAGFGIAWWFLAHSVESSVIPIVDVINEHRVYLPSIGLFAAAAVGVVWVARRRLGDRDASRGAVAAGVALAMVLALATFARNRAWASDVSIWTDAALKSPQKSRPALNLGTALVEAGRPGEAVPSLRRAVELDPGSSYARAQLAAALLSIGRAAEAEPELREVLRMTPDNPEALFNLATLAWNGRRLEEARALYARFLAVAPRAYDGARRVAEARAVPAPR